MKIHLGCDHAGFELKEKVAQHLKSKGHEVIDHGAKTYDALDDYPVFCFLAAKGAAQDPKSLAIVDAFINTNFSNDERHMRRINQLSEYENGGKMPPLPN